MVSSPEELTPSDEVRLQITPTGGLNSSTFEPHSFVVTNMAGNAQSITYITIDLSTTIFQDMVYDPNGEAGDKSAKNLEVDSNGSGVGFLAHGFAGPHDEGYDQLNIAFNNFGPGETFSFSVDVDPTSIRGVEAPGPFESGSVSGLELVGATVTVTFADTTQVTGQTYRLPNSVGGSEAVVRSSLPLAPSVQVAGISGSTAVVTEAEQILEIEAFSRGTIKALVIEGGLFLDGVPNGGYDLDPFESNSALNVGGAGAGQGSGDVDPVEVDLRILLARHLQIGHQAHQDDHYEGDIGQRVIGDQVACERHVSRCPLRWPAPQQDPAGPAPR
jgi:hypothetical protein